MMFARRIIFSALTGAMLCTVAGAAAGLVLALIGRAFGAHVSIGFWAGCGAVCVLLGWVAFWGIRLCNTYLNHVSRRMTISRVERRSYKYGETLLEITTREHPEVLLCCAVDRVPRDLHNGEPVLIRVPKGRLYRGEKYLVWSVHRAA